MNLAAVLVLASSPGIAAQEPGGDAAEQSGFLPRGTQAAEGGSPAVAGSYSETQVKAAFLFHFATYAEWPTAPGEEPLSFAVLRDTDIAEELASFAHGRTIQGRAVRVRDIRSLSELDGDEVLFIGSSQNRRLAQLIDEVNSPTLVVTDAPDGLPDGAMINFQLVERRVRFEVALPAVQRVGLTLSSRLLSAAMRVEMSRCHLECYVHEAKRQEYAAHLPLVRTSTRA